MSDGTNDATGRAADVDEPDTTEAEGAEGERDPEVQPTTTSVTCSPIQNPIPTHSSWSRSTVAIWPRRVSC